VEQLVFLLAVKTHDRIEAVQQALKFRYAARVGSFGRQIRRHIGEQPNDPKYLAMHAAHRRHRIVSAQ